MIYTTQILREKYKYLANPDRKIKTLVTFNSLYKICRGYYEDNPNISGRYIASVIYGPSYLSFDYALSFYGLIPEHIIDFTSATYSKNKTKKFKNRWGEFLYRDVPKKVYYKGVILIQENGYTYPIATKEKALCDKLYSLQPLKDKTELSHMLFDNLRIDKTLFRKLIKKEIYELEKLYRCKNIYLLADLLRSGDYE